MSIGWPIDGITDYLKQHWPAIREQLLSGTLLQPKPVRRVKIPKPDGGGGSRRLFPHRIASCALAPTIIDCASAAADWLNSSVCIFFTEYECCESRL